MNTKPPMVIEHDAAAGEFRGRVGGDVCHIRYRLSDDVLDIRSTFVPPSLRGSGRAGELTRHVVEYAQMQGLKVMPSCPYTPVWFRRNPGYAGVLADGGAFDYR